MNTSVFPRLSFYRFEAPVTRQPDVVNSLALAVIGLHQVLRALTWMMCS